MCSRAFSLDSPRIVSPDLAATLESLLVHTLRKLAAVRSLFHRLREVRDGDREGHARSLATRKRQVRPVRRFEWTWHAGSKSGDGDDKCVVYTQSLSRVHWAGTSSALHGKNRLLTPSFRTARTPPPPSLNHSHHNRVWSTQQVCLLDVGITFRALWSVISPMLDTHTSEKVAMLKGEAMHKYFGEHFTIPQAAFMAQVMGMKPVPGSLPRELMAELGQPFDERA